MFVIGKGRIVFDVNFSPPDVDNEGSIPMALCLILQQMRVETHMMFVEWMGE